MMKAPRASSFFLSLLCTTLALGSTTLCFAAAPSVITLTLASTTVTAGTPVEVTATVTAAGAVVHPGRVLFCNAAAPHCEDSAILGRAQLTRAGTATTHLRLGIGSYSVKAVFVGVPGSALPVAASSSAAQSLTVQPAGEIPSFTFLSTPAATGGSYTLSGTVATPGLPPLGGSLSFTDTTNGSVSLGTVPLSGVSRSVLFETAPSAAAGLQPAALAIADFNNDGIPDMAVVNADAQSLTILLGKGDGTFTFRKTIDLGFSVSSIAVADFNNDGNLDLVVGNSDPGYVNVLFGTGNGNFLPLPNWVYDGGGNTAITTGDYDGDGNPDFATVSTDKNKVHIFYGNGDGTFRRESDLPVNGFPVSLTTADFNGDGVDDLAVALNSPFFLNSSTVLFLGKAGGFGTLTDGPPAGAAATGITTADFNGDGIPDLAVSCSNSGQPTLYILLGNGDGAFTGGPMLAIDYTVTNIESADFNGDGITDLLAGSQLFLGKGNGTFVAQSLRVPYFFSDSPIVADVNGDGVPDVVSSDFSNNAVTISLGEQAKTASIRDISIPARDLPNIVASYSGHGLYKPSESAGFAMGNTTATPVIFPGSGAYGSPTTITITDATPGAVIYYQVGTTSQAPGNPILYTGPFTLPIPPTPAAITEVSATAIAPGYLTSGFAFEGYEYAAPTITTLYFNFDPVRAGDRVILSAHVTANGVPFHDGIIVFCNAEAAHCEDSAILGTAPLSAGGWAQVRLRLGAGVYKIRADFQGISHPPSDPYLYEPPLSAPSSSATKTLTVTGKSATSTERPTAAQANGAFTLTSRVLAFGRAAIGGTLTFEDSVNGGKAASLGSTVLNPANTVVRLTPAAATITGKDPVALAAADLNGDGIPDLVTANAGENTLSILLGKGDGTFALGSTIALPAAPTFVAIGDVNADRHADLVVTFTDADSIAVLLGNGDGTFTPKTTIAAPGGPRFTLLADVNGDGILDIATADTTSSMVTIFYGDGDGNFLVRTSLVTPSNPVSLAVGDFKGDSVLDLATSNSDGSVSILLATGDFPAFTTAASLYPGGYGSIVTGDFNNDGIVDLAVPSSNGVAVYLGKGDGTFTLKSTLPATDVQSLTVADFNSDGNSDIIVTQNTASQYKATLFLGNGDGTFPRFSRPAFPFATSGLVADFNGDGLPDFAASDPNHNAVGVLLGARATTGAIRGVTLSTPGTHLISATYSGSPSFDPSTGPPITIVIPPPAH